MAPGTPKQRAVRLQENEEVAAKILEKHRSLREKQSFKENHDLTFSTAYRNVCAAKEPIRTLEDLYRIKGVGKWIIREMKGSFPETSPDLSPPKSNTAGEKGKKTKGPKRYKPTKNSAAYAILITLYREMISGNSFMGRQELIDAAEASGLSETAIGTDKGKVKPGSSGISKDWYTGWSCMTKTLIPNGLVEKSGKPAKYMLTEEGKNIASDCLSRSASIDSAGSSMITNALNTCTAHRNSNHLFMGSAAAETSLRPCTGHSLELVCSNSVTMTSQELIQLTSQEQLNYNSEVQTNSNCPEKLILSNSDLDEPYKGNSLLIEKGSTTNFGAPDCSVSICPLSSQGTFELQSSSTVGSAEFNMLDDNSILPMPPRQSNEKFLEAYEIVLILDDREKFGSHSRKVVGNISSQFRVPVEMKRLPVGDGIWVARHRKLHTEYVLDFIVERKNVEDLLSSIRDNRYRDQKLRLKKCGLRKLIYLVEGDPNKIDGSESIKTACFTTEILEGFDVQRTTGYSDTERKYGYLTLSIIEYYSTNFSIGANTSRVCMTYDEFEKKCCDLEKLTVSDVFALQLMQVPHVTEEAALAVIELYPTLFSLARAYSMLNDDTHAQEEMLKNKSKMINAGASKKIFKLVWGER